MRCFGCTAMITIKGFASKTRAECSWRIGIRSFLEDSRPDTSNRFGIPFPFRR
jgi:hypothetical protein